VPANNSEGWQYSSVQIGPQSVQIQQSILAFTRIAPQSLSDAAASGTMTVTANLVGCSWSVSSNEYRLP
jgi:hypothetical protein